MVYNFQLTKVNILIVLLTAQVITKTSLHTTHFNEGVKSSLPLLQNHLHPIRLLHFFIKITQFIESIGR